MLEESKKEVEQLVKDFMEKWKNVGYSEDFLEEQIIELQLRIERYDEVKKAKTKEERIKAEVKLFKEVLTKWLDHWLRSNAELIGLIKKKEK